RDYGVAVEYGDRVAGNLGAGDRPGIGEVDPVQRVCIVRRHQPADRAEEVRDMQHLERAAAAEEGDVRTARDRVDDEGRTVVGDLDSRRAGADRRSAQIERAAGRFDRTGAVQRAAGHG